MATISPVLKSSCGRATGLSWKFSEFVSISYRKRAKQLSTLSRISSSPLFESKFYISFLFQVRYCNVKFWLSLPVLQLKGCAVDGAAVVVLFHALSQQEPSFKRFLPDMTHADIHIHMPFYVHGVFVYGCSHICEGSSWCRMYLWLVSPSTSGQVSWRGMAGNLPAELRVL